MFLDILRREPLIASQHYAYYFDPHISIDFGSPDIGGPVYIRRDRICKENMHDGIQLCQTISAGSTPNFSMEDPDFYFPYDHRQGFIGFVRVYEKCEKGTIVFTTGMNGCALDVRYDAAHHRFMFYHDKNGNNQYLIPGGMEQVCRIEAQDYWNTDRMLGISDAMNLPMVQFICVKSGELEWTLIASGILLSGDKVTGAFRPFHPSDSNGVCYRGTFSPGHPLFEHWP